MRDLPDGWRWVRLADLAPEGGKYGSGEAAIDYDPSLPRYVRITDIEADGRLSTQTRASIKAAAAKPYMLKKGDLLFARSGATVGKTYLYNDADGVCAHAGYVIKFSIDESLALPNYVAHWTRGSHYWRWVNSTLRQGAQPNINASEYGNHKIPLPPICEQRRIAEIFDTLDEDISNAEMVIQKLSTLEWGLLHDLLSYHTKSILASEGWQWMPVAKVGDVKLGRQRSPQHESGRYMRPYLRVANVFDGYIDYSDVLEMNFTPSEQEVFGLQRGDILLNEGQSLELVGRSAIFDGPPGMCFQNTLVRFRARLVTPEYAQAVFRYWLSTGAFMQIAKQTTSIAHLGADRFARMMFPVPPRDIETRLVHSLESVASRIKAERDRMRQLNLLKQGLMEDLLTGRVRVSEAEAVLERL